MLGIIYKSMLQHFFKLLIDRGIRKMKYAKMTLLVKI